MAWIHDSINTNRIQVQTNGVSSVQKGYTLGPLLLAGVTTPYVETELDQANRGAMVHGTHIWKQFSSLI